MKIHKRYLTETNEQILERQKGKTGEPVHFGIIQKNMDEVLLMINNVGNSGNKEQDLLEIATNILGAITLKQPFMDGNRRTGIIAAGKFLRENGYDLDIDPEEVNSELRLMLRKIKNRLFTLDPEVMEQLSFIFQKGLNHMSRKDKKINDELIEKYSKLLDDLAHDD